MLGSATGILKNDTVLVFGSSSGALSVEYSGEPNSRPLPLTVGSRRSDETRSCMYLSGADQSQVVTTRLRSTPVGRGGLLFGNSPLATRSVQSPKYLYGTPPNWPAMRLVIISPAWPDWMRRCQASAPLSNLPNCDGMVRVAS